MSEAEKRGYVVAAVLSLIVMAMCMLYMTLSVVQLRRETMQQYEDWQDEFNDSLKSYRN